MSWIKGYIAASYLSILGMLIANYIEGEVFRNIVGFLIATWMVSYPIVFVIYLVKRPPKTEVSLSLIFLSLVWVFYAFVLYLTYQMFDSMMQ